MSTLSTHFQATFSPWVGVELPRHTFQQQLCTWVGVELPIGTVLAEGRRRVPVGPGRAGREAARPITPVGPVRTDAGRDGAQRDDPGGKENGRSGLGAR